MKSLEKATLEYEKAKERMESAKSRYEAELKKFRACEAAKTEAENLAIVMAFRELHIPVSQLKTITNKMKEGLPDLAVIKEDTKYHDESGKNEDGTDKEETGDVTANQNGSGEGVEE